MSVGIDYSSGAFAANKAQGVGTVAQAQAGYDIANASYDSVSFSVTNQEAFPTDVFLKSDGTKMYICGKSGDAVYEYTLSTAYNVSTASYVRNFSVSSQTTSPSGLFFKSDGTKMYVLGSDVYEYNLSTAWDISTASYVQTFDVGNQDTNPKGIFIKSDGTKMYITGDSGNDINEYSLSTAWDISTASYSQNFSVSSQDTEPTGLFFKPDGTKMFVCGVVGDDINEYSLSTAWDISTASYSQNFSVSSQDGVPFGLFFKSDGTKMYLMGFANDTVFQYSTGSYVQNLDISSGTYFNYTPSANTTFTFGNAPASGTAAGFALAVTGANVGETYDIANASYANKSFSVQSQDNFLRDIAFKPDGTSLYAVGASTGALYQYTLSTAYDISTASYANKSLSISSQENNPMALDFNSDGTKVYVVGLQNKSIYQYSLSTPYDLSTGSYDSVSFSLNSQDSAPRAWKFFDSGTKMIMTGGSGARLFQYALSTAYDLSTASYNNINYYIGGSMSSPRGTAFNSDGTKLFVVDYFSPRDVKQFNLSTAYNISTASYSSTSFVVGSQQGQPYGLIFSADGSKMYVSGEGANDTMFQYTAQAASTATFTYPSSVKFSSGTAPTGPAIGETDVLVFYTNDGGTTYQGFQSGDAMA